MCQIYVRSVCRSFFDDAVCMFVMNPNTPIVFGSLYTVLRPAQEFFTYIETSPLPVKGCKI
jgi:hypothetical protein